MTTPTLSISDLFTPAQSGVGNSPTLPPATGTWLAILLTIANTVGLPTTAWEPGGPERTILAIAAVALAQEDCLVSKFAQGGFLQFAAFGTVTYVDTSGNQITAYVTPDPSNPAQNATGAPGWLDALCQSYFQEERLQATRASGTLAIVNRTPGTLGPYVAGTYHVANAVTKATYANTASLTIPSSVIAAGGGTVTGVTAGAVTTVATQSAHGLGVGNVVYVDGTQGISLLNGSFATITNVPSPTTFQIGVTSTGTWTSGGTVYACTLGAFQADILGTNSNAAPRQITKTVTQNAGVGCANLTSWSASNYESNAAYLARSKLSLAALSPNGPAAAYEYVALTAQRLLAAEEPPVALSNGTIAQAKSFGDPVAGTTIVTVASATPASAVTGQAITPGCSQLSIIGATNATPIVIQTSAAHLLVTGYTATIAGVLGNAAANGTWPITVVDATHFSLNGSVGNGAYTAATGVVDGGDLGEVDTLIQARVVPSGNTAITQSALALAVTVVATVIVPQAYVATFIAASSNAISTYLASLPIGGFVAPGAVAGVVPISQVTDALEEIGVLTIGGGTYVKQIQNLRLNGVAADLAFPTSQYQSVLATATIAVVGV